MTGPYGESFGNLTDKDLTKYKAHLDKFVVGQKDTAGKPDLTLIPYNSLVAVAKVREYGNKKYGDPWMWRINAKPKDVKDFVAAALRHINKYTDPLEHYRDDESNLHHLWHAAASLMMAISIEQDFDLDDKQHFDGN